MCGQWHRSTGRMRSGGKGDIGPIGSKRGETEGKSTQSGESEVIRAVGDELVAESFANFGVLQNKDAGHAHYVAGGESHKVSAKEGAERAQNTFGIEILVNLRANQAKGLIEARVGIAETRNLEQAIGREKPFGFSSVPRWTKASWMFLASIDLRFSAISATASRQKVQPKWRRNTSNKGRSTVKEASVWPFCEV